MNRFQSRVVVSIAAATFLPTLAAAADPQCEGYDLLPKPRPETSCQTIVSKIYPSPDKKFHATVLPADISLDATPDMESRVVIRTVAGSTLNSHNHSSPRGANGYYVDQVRWSPDSQFFVYNLVSSGGHSPWSHPTMIYSVQANRFANFSAMIDGKPLLSEKFEFTAPHTLTATTWKKDGAPDDPMPITVDLADAFAKLKPE